MSGRHDAADIAQALAARVDVLAPELLRHGRRQGDEFRAASVAGEAGGSLSLRLRGAKRGIWCDFATGQRGDLLDLVAVARFGGDLRLALGWARSWLGLSGARAGVPAPVPLQPASAGGAPDADAEKRRQAAFAMFMAARPLPGTPAQDYLRGRGIDLAVLGRAPGALRFHPHLWNTESRCDLPAMVGAVVDADGRFLGLHRTWLQSGPAGRWHKARLKTPKASLGPIGGGFIPLARGRSGKPLRQAPEGDVAALAEGIETALSVAIACPELRVLAAISLSNMQRLALPQQIRSVIVCGDGDTNPTARQALDRAVDRLVREGRSVRVAVAPGGTDFNDVLQGALA